MKQAVIFLCLAVLVMGGWSCSKPSSQTKSRLEPKVYTVNRTVAQFPEKEDLLTPESAYAAVARVRTSGHEKDFERVFLGFKESETEARVAARHWRMVGPEESGKFQASLLNASIIEVWLTDAGKSAVIAATDGTDHGSMFDIRHFVFKDGKWLSSGQDGVKTIDEAREHIKRKL